MAAGQQQIADLMAKAPTPAVMPSRFPAMPLSILTDNMDEPARFLTRFTKLMRDTQHTQRCVFYIAIFEVTAPTA
jgi:hypothetical protein